MSEQKCVRTECEEYLMRRVKLGYVADAPTSVQLVDSIGNQVFDLLPIIQAGETDTSISLLSDIKRIRYYPEKFTRTEGRDGCYYDICIKDIAALIELNDLGNVEDVETLQTGQTIVYNAATQQYEMFDLAGTLNSINQRFAAVEGRLTIVEGDITTINGRIDLLTNKINQLTQIIGDLALRLENIENAIYNWADDKTTKIPRGTINITSGGPNSDWIIQSREKDQDNDLDFQ